MKKVFIETFEQACEVIGIDANQLPDVSWMPGNRARAMTATYKMDIIEAAQKKLDGFVPDYGNDDQWKYYPWFEWVASRSAFVYTGTTYTGTFTDLGSRFCFIDRQTAEFMGTKHQELYNDMMLKS